LHLSFCNHLDLHDFYLLLGQISVPFLSSSLLLFLWVIVFYFSLNLLLLHSFFLLSLLLLDALVLNVLTAYHYLVLDLVVVLHP